jgi:hypothetical protein
MTRARAPPSGRRSEGERQHDRPRDAGQRPPADLAIDPQLRHARGKDRERLLHLRAGEVGTETVVRAAAEGERRTRSTVMSKRSGSVYADGSWFADEVESDRSVPAGMT